MRKPLTPVEREARRLQRKYDQWMKDPHKREWIERVASAVVTIVHGHVGYEERAIAIARKIADDYGDDEVVGYISNMILRRDECIKAIEEGTLPLVPALPKEPKQ